jgi:hypothetical protein
MRRTWTHWRQAGQPVRFEDREDRLGARREDVIHDGLNRLTAATTAAYGALGNIAAKSDVGAYTHDGAAVLARMMRSWLRFFRGAGRAMCRGCEVRRPIPSPPFDSLRVRPPAGPHRQANIMWRELRICVLCKEKPTLISRADCA